MAKVNYGVAGIRQRDYRVWINFEDMSSSDGELDYITAVDKMGEAFVEITDDPPQYPDAKAQLDLLKASMYHVGEMRADSIDLTVEDGDSVEGNEVGKVVMGKIGRFSCELINSTPDILTWLGQRDTKSCIIMLEEIAATNMVDYGGPKLETHEIVFIGNVPSMAANLTDNVGGAFNYAEKIIGKGIATSTISLEKTVPTAGAFRKILNFRYEEPSTAPEQEAPVIADDKVTIKWSWLAEPGTADVDGFTVEISSDSGFAEVVRIDSVVGKSSVSLDFENMESGTFYSRVYGTINGVQKTAYSGTKTITIS